MATQAYYETVAQLLPLLFITVLVEHRLLRQDPVTVRWQVVNAASTVFVALTCLAIAVSEAEILYALRRTNPDPHIDDDVRAALILTGVALLAPVARRALTGGRGLGSRQRAAAFALGVVAAAAVWIAAGLLSR
jgi:hypothetical protein